MPITSLDHLVLTVRDLDATLRFYTKALGATEITFDDGRKAIAVGYQNIKLHIAGHEIEPKATHHTPGSADLCFLADTPVAETPTRLAAKGIAVELGPVPRSGANGPITSIYLRDPDGNLVEIATPAP